MPASFRVWVTDPTEHPHDPGFLLPDKAVPMPPKGKAYAMRGHSHIVAVYDTVNNDWPGYLAHEVDVAKGLREGTVHVARSPIQDW